MSLFNLKWQFHYVPENTFEPDEYNRWMVEGSLLIPVKDLAPYNTNHLTRHRPATVARITMKGTANANFVDHPKLPKFNLRVWNILERSGLFNTGWGETSFMSDDFEELKERAEKTISFTYEMFTRSLRYDPERD